MGSGDGSKVFLALVHILAPLDDHGAHAALDQPQGGKQPPGACTYNHHLRGTGRQLVVDGVLIGIILRLLVDIHPHLEVDENGTLAGVDAALEHPHGLDGAGVDSLLSGYAGLDVLLACRLLGRQSQLVFVCHDIWCAELFFVQN